MLVKAAEIIRAGGVIAFPTDSCYALGCHLGDKDALERIRAIRDIDDRHPMTLMCRDLSEIAHFAKVDNAQYRLLKAVTPGSYVFILEGTKELPRRVLHPKRKTLGLRIPDHAGALALLEELGEPLLTATLQLPGDEAPLTEGWEIQDRLDDHVELILDGGYLLWRFGMFLPFALITGLALKFRPSLLPYFVVVHALMDVTTVLVYLMI